MDSLTAGSLIVDLNLFVGFHDETVLKNTLKYIQKILRNSIMGTEEFALIPSRLFFAPRSSSTHLIGLDFLEI